MRGKLAAHVFFMVITFVLEIPNPRLHFICIVVITITIIVNCMQCRIRESLRFWMMELLITSTVNSLLLLCRTFRLESRQ